MELRLLRYFIVLAEELHFGRAARRLSITQPPLSFGIRQLEEYLGGRLFERDSRRVILTSMGTAFLLEAIRTVAQARIAEETARAIAGGRAGSLQIGFTGSMLYRGMPEILDLFSQSHPGIDIRLMDMTVAEQAVALQQFRIHCGFTPAESVAPGLSGQALAPDAFVCCVPEKHWAANRRRIRLESLASEDFIIFSREITPAGYDHVLQLCLAAGFAPRERAFVRQWLTAVALVSKGVGIAIVPSTMRQAISRNVRFIPIDGTGTETAGYFMWHPKAVSPALELLGSTVQAYLQSSVRRPRRRSAAA
ncbi:MAG TPA: LysR family transcriptional regulator [Burkholderiaceae bacterium]|jgi:DNA-binding transcriptional LysR family regulator